jgi:hypothetical protein
MVVTTSVIAIAANLADRQAQPSICWTASDE